MHDIRSRKTDPVRFLILSGSERINGNTDLVVSRIYDHITELGEHASVIHLREQRIEPFGTCGGCNFRSDPCAVNDDTATIIARMKAADAIIYAASVRGFGLGWLMQNFIERSGVGHLRFDRPLADKVAGVVVRGRRYSLPPTAAPSAETRPSIIAKSRLRPNPGD